MNDLDNDLSHLPSEGELKIDDINGKYEELDDKDGHMNHYNRNFKDSI